MEDLAGEFQQDFLEAVKTLEDFSSSDGDLREALKTIRIRVDSKAYSCAPKFWDDLRDSLADIERKRDDKSSKSKANQVLKQIARLEVRFWAKESLGMLQVLDAASRLERLVDWIQTFEAGDSSDQSSGPAVLYQVLNDIGIQKDMDPLQRDALMVAVRENLHKFPVSMQGMLERVGSLTGGIVGPRTVADWRRRNMPTQPPPPKPQPARPVLRFISPKAASEAVAAGSGPGEAAAGAVAADGSMQSEALTSAAVQGAETASAVQADADGDDQDIDGTPIECLGPPLPGPGKWMPAHANDEDDDAMGESVVTGIVETLTAADVEPKVLEKARRAVLVVLASNSGECRRQHVRTLLRQLGIAGLPIAALGDEIFFSGTDVFLRRPSALALRAAAPTSKIPVPEDLQQRMVELVRADGNRIALTRLAELMQWQSGSARHAAHGPLRKAVGQVPQLFHEPQKVFTMAAAKSQLACLAVGEDEPQEVVEAADQQVNPSVPYVADAFSQLLVTILAWLEQAEGVIDQNVVLPLIRHLGIKPRAVISALSKQVYWAHPEADCEIMLRTTTGAAKHPKPLPDVYLHAQTHQNILMHIKNMGPKAKLDKLSGLLGWNARSEMKRVYGTLRVVLCGLRTVFFDPQRIYLKRAMEGLVEWPVNREGRLGPSVGDEVPKVQHWTPAADDMRSAGDPEWLNAKRQIIGVLMSTGGQCQATVLRQVLAALPLRHGEDGSGSTAIELEELVELGGARDLSDVLYWGRDRVRCRQPEAIDNMLLLEECQVPTDVMAVLLDTVQAHGTASLEQLQEALDTAQLSMAVETLVDVLPRIPEFFFTPEVVYLRHLVDAFTITEAKAAPAPPEVTAIPGSDRGASDAAIESRVNGVPALGEPAASLGPPAAIHDVAAAPAVEGSAVAVPVVVSSNALAAEAVAGISPGQLDNVGVNGDDGCMAELAKGPGESAGGNFFSFTNFEDGPGAVEKAPKKQRLDTEGNSVATPTDGNWREAPPWAAEGAAVKVRAAGGDAADQDAFVVRSTGDLCMVRWNQAGSSVQAEFPISRLIPVAPAVGACVRVIGGDRSGCCGQLVGLAGRAAGVVQINKMSYETLPMSQLVVIDRA
eukprot:TRINITY_DN75751_c0_g1_i1.p1 TRINITY_DN75751_c0_g1~~TRINITY_DN75751_c0_g1_i1.p1  ORF type:complete len:1128 (+),score=222.03 TRINITY_DN75751_c0_g1_i1:61-3384(+)